MLTQHSAINLGTGTIAKQPVLGPDAVFHALDHHFHEHALDLGGDCFRIRLFACRKGCNADARDHYMISSSACKAPAVLSASRMAMVSRGVTPSAFNVRIRSSIVAPLARVTKLLFCSWAVTFVSGTTAVCPAEND